MIHVRKLSKRYTNMSPIKASKKWTRSERTNARKGSVIMFASGLFNQELVTNLAHSTRGILFYITNISPVSVM
jgi:hypothetical protein